MEKIQSLADLEDAIKLLKYKKTTVNLMEVIEVEFGVREEKKLN